MIPFPALSAAITASVVGFGGTLALIVAAAQAVGASPLETASWITAIAIAIGLESIALSWRYRMPVVTAYSTAGAALIGATHDLTMHEAVGAFIVAAILLIATGLVGPLTRMIGRIPPAIAAGMLAGIMIGFPIGAARSLPGDIMLLGPLVVLFFAIRRVNAPLAAIGVLMAGIVYAVVLGRVPEPPVLGFATLTLIEPHFTVTSAIGLGVPLYLVTMAAQNLPGMAVLHANAYHPPAGPLIGLTGLGSLISAPFGASTTNLSAITASICVNPEAHPDHNRRWVTGIAYGVCYLVFGAFGASIAGLIAALPFDLIMLVAGLALLTPLVGALTIALKDDDQRLAAIVTLAVTASGVTAFSVGAAFWGLAAGISVLLATRKSV